MPILTLVRTTTLLSILLVMSACGGKVPEQEASVAEIATPAAAGSIAPNLAPGPDGTLVMSWLEPAADDGHALKYSVLADTTWGPPSVVASGPNWFANWADFPSVTPVSDGLWGAHWLVRREAGGYAYDIHAAISDDGGQNWSEPFIPHTDDTDTEHGFVSMYPAGDGVGMVWLDGRKFVNEVTDDVIASGMTLRGGTFAADLAARDEVLLDDLICDCCQTDIALAATGPVAIYRNRTEQEIRDIYVARFVNGAWQAGNAVSDDNWEIPGCPVNGPVIKANGNNVVAVWFSAPGDKGRVQAAWSDDSGASFAVPIEVSTEQPLGHVGAVLLENNDLVVSWQRRNSAGSTELNLRRISADGSRSEAFVVSMAEHLFSFSVPQIAQVGGNLILAWTEEIDSINNIRTAAVPTTLLNSP